MAKTEQRITIFLTYLGGGGAERVMFNLARGFVQHGVKVDLAIANASSPHLEKVPPELRIVDLQAKGVVSTTWALVRYLRREQPVALLSALHYANEIAVWAKRIAGVSTKVVVTEHNTFSQAIRRTSKTRRRLLPFFVRYFYPWADGIVAVSQGAAQDLANNTGLPIESIQAIYNPVITPELLQKAKQPLDINWFAPEAPPVILGVGKLEAQKDFATLIRAFAQVRQVRPARLMILGWGPDRPQLEALVKELGLEADVSLCGYVDNPYPYMAKASVFVLSSAWEGLPTVLIEAMAVRTPVVSTDCPSGAAEILGNGKYGSLVPVGDNQALAKAILAVLDGKQKTVEPGWLDRFSLEVTTKQYLDVLGLTETQLSLVRELSSPIPL